MTPQAPSKIKIDKLVLAKVRGFCAGVVRAIEVVEKTLEICGKPVYVRHEIIHNRYVVDELRKKGAVFVEELSEVPEGSWLIFSAHGVGPVVVQEARGRKLKRSTRPARWSPRSTWRPSRSPSRTTRSS